MLAPAGTPKTIVNRIQADLAALLRTAQTRERFVALGMEVYATSGVELEAYLDSEIAKWSKVIRAAGVRAE
jgi:tripartite-type tricarboxylate transporter receptor subunit TctC